MSAIPARLISAIDQLSKIPGVGRKTALRQALQLSQWDRDDLKVFSEAISGLSEIKRCTNCGMYCDDQFCAVCQAHKRIETGAVCVVESVTDYIAIENSEKYFGTYHVLGGVLNPLLGIGPDELNFRTLLDRVKRGEAKSLILAINPSVEGDATCSYIRQVVPEDVQIERIGFGIPIGGSLEYVDSMTISKALENRKSL